MSFSVVVNDALREAMLDETMNPEQVSPGDIVSKALAETIKDDAVRRELYDEVRYDVEEISMADIHTIMDKLLVVLGEVHG